LITVLPDLVVVLGGDERRLVTLAAVVEVAEVPKRRGEVVRVHPAAELCDLAHRPDLEHVGHREV
jgi:hypothetical protein